MDENRIWHLLARKLSREITLEELREFEQMLLQDPSLTYRIDLYTSYYEQPVVPLRSPEEMEDSWKKTLVVLQQEAPEHFVHITNTPVYRSRKFLTAAVAGMLILATAAWYLLMPVKPAANPAISAVQEMNTSPGTRTKLILPDGTQVWMNSASHLYYNADFGATNREVTLIGEAFFDVTHNASLPMVVHARSVNILVKGTAFNVRNYPEAPEVEASLLRGSIELTTNADPGRKILLRPNEKITIETTPDTMKAATPSSRPVLQPAQPYYHIAILRESTLSKTIPEVSWMENKLVFENETFSGVAIKMEKWYNVRIVLKNKDLGSRQVSGVFEKENVSEALSALQMTIPFEFTMKGNTILIR